MSNSPDTADEIAPVTLVGPDALTFLQGYLTCDLDALDGSPGGDAIPMAYCNIKGRVVANGWVWGTPDHLELAMHTSVRRAFEQDLSKYLPFAKSKLEVPDSRYAIAEGPTRQAQESVVTLAPFGWHLTRGAAAEDDAASDTDDAWAALCIANGVAIVSAATSGQFLPQMLDLTTFGTVSFDKGCYLGQEVVARAEHRGAVKRRLRRYAANGPPPSPGDAVHEDQKRVGTIINVTGSGDAIELLAVTNTDVTPLTCRGSTLTSPPAG